MQPSMMSRDDFVAAFGGVYEHSPWIAQAAHERGLSPAADSAQGLSAALRTIVDAAPRARQLELLRSHPDLAGRLAQAGELTPDSASEQAAAGLGQCSAEELAQFTALNGTYVDKFGFPFIVAVRGLDRLDVLAQFEARVGNEMEAEVTAALAQVHRIAFLRLSAKFEQAA